MTSKDDEVLNNIYGVDAIVDSDCWGTKDIDSINGSRVSFGVGS